MFVDKIRTEPVQQKHQALSRMFHLKPETLDSIPSGACTAIGVFPTKKIPTDPVARSTGGDTEGGIHERSDVYDRTSTEYIPAFSRDDLGRGDVHDAICPRRNRFPPSALPSPDDVSQRIVPGRVEGSPPGYRATHGADIHQTRPVGQHEAGPVLSRVL